MESITPTLVVVAFYKLNPEDVDIFSDIIRSHVQEVANNTPGCAFYKFAADINDPSLIHLTEGWLDQASLDKHLASASFQAVRAEALARVRVESYDSQIYKISGQTNLEMSAT